jgi:ABC-type branched-subunit amino acid transport system substrate-binding protein
VSAGRLVLGAPLSLTGRYGFLGRLAAAGLRQAVQDARTLGGIRIGEERLAPELHVIDDGGTRTGVRRALEEVAEADLLVGPYGSDLVDEAARWAAERGRVLWNHGGSADEVERLPGVVSVPSPASRYLGQVLGALADSLPGARVVVATRRGLFGRSAVVGARDAIDRLGMTLLGTVEPDEAPEAATDADVVLAAGTFGDDVELVRRLRARPAAVAAVAAGISLFGPALGPGAEGILGPSQWEEGARFPVDLGPRQADAVRALRAEVMPTLRLGPGGVDYPAAQAYAGGLVAMRCAEEAGTTQDQPLLETARRLRRTTFFGRFGLGDDNRQEDHEILVVQWQQGVKRIVWPPSLAEASPIL